MTLLRNLSVRLSLWRSGLSVSRAAAPRAVTARGLATRVGATGAADHDHHGASSSWGKFAAFAGTAGAIAFVAASRPSADAKAVPIEGIPGTTYERTFLMIKPDGVQRGLINEIIRRWEQRGFTLVGLKMLVPSKALAESHYLDLRARPFYPALVDYISSSGPVVAMVWQGKDVIRTSRQMIGTTDPLVSPPGTVRGDLACFVGRNVIHGSDGVDGAEAEIPLWFGASEIMLVDSKANPWLYDDRA